MPSQAEKGELFRSLHHGDSAFILPNPWNAGTAKMFASVGYQALATTSAGFAHSVGKPDGAVSRAEAMEHCAEIVAATDLPVSADLERGFGDSPEHAAQTVMDAAAAGLAGCSIEDASGNPDSPIYEFALAKERIVAAVEAARTVGFTFTLTARTENFFHGRDDLVDTVKRLQAFEEAGADVLYAPGLPDFEAMSAVVNYVGLPVNLLADPRYTVAELSSTGAKRISLGSYFSRAAMGATLHAAKEVLEQGTFGFAADKPPGDLNGLFRE